MSYDAEKASVAAAFSEESVRRGFINKLASLEATLVRNYDLTTDGGEVKSY